MMPRGSALTQKDDSNISGGYDRERKYGEERYI
jgi:hypothetical protein